MSWPTRTVIFGTVIVNHSQVLIYFFKKIESILAWDQVFSVIKNALKNWNNLRMTSMILFYFLKKKKTDHMYGRQTI